MLNAAPIVVACLGSLVCGQPMESKPSAMEDASAREAAVRAEALAADGDRVHRVATAGGVVLRVREWGEGDPVLVLSGGPGFSGDQMLSTAAVVAESHRAIVPDQRGTPGSPLASFEMGAFDPSAFSIEGAVADLEAVRRELGLESWTLVGHSWGGLLSMAYAAAHPERVDRMVLVSPAGIDASFWATYQQNIMTRLSPEASAKMSELRPTAQSLDGYAELARQSNILMAEATLENKAAGDALRAEMRADGFEPRVALLMQGAMMSYDFKPALKTFEKPVVVIQGAGDPIGPEASQRIVDSVPGAKRVLLEGVGHWPFHEAPAKYAAALRRALAGD
jgi:proline iminopeptidase